MTAVNGCSTGIPARSPCNESRSAASHDAIRTEAPSSVSSDFDRGGTVGRVALSADEQQVACTMTSHQMPGEQRPEHAGTARDQHRAFGIEWRGHGEHQLANVAGTTQESIGIGCLSDVPRTQRKRTQFARLEELHQLAKHLAEEFRGDVVEEIERLILNTRMPRRHLARVSDVCFAQLDESPAARQESQRCIDEFFFQAIDYDVHTCSAGRAAENFCSKSSVREFAI